jgi:RsiW-degrading membrane proteinase PrsW (M82 family)
VVRSSSLPPPAEELAYRIELWRENGNAVERILARAASAALGHAIFKAAQVEHPGRRITLSTGERIIADSVA